MYMRAYPVVFSIMTIPADQGVVSLTFEITFIDSIWLSSFLTFVCNGRVTCWGV